MFRLYHIRHLRAIYDTCDVWKHRLSVIQNEQMFQMFLSIAEIKLYHIVDCYRLTWFGLHGYFSVIVFNFRSLMFLIYMIFL